MIDKSNQLKKKDYRDLTGKFTSKNKSKLYLQSIFLLKKKKSYIRHFRNVNQMATLTRKFQHTIISTIDWFYSPFSKIISEETFRYGVTGGANTVLDIFLYFIFYNFVIDKQIIDLGFVSISPHIAAFLMVFPITFSTGFILAKYITFTQSEIKGRVQLIRYGVSVGGSIILNYLLLKLFVEVVGLYATLSKLLTTCVVILYSFIIQKYYTFQTGNKIFAHSKKQ